jgi:hypothetical protein
VFENYIAFDRSPVRAQNQGGYRGTPIWSRTDTGKTVPAFSGPGHGTGKQTAAKRSGYGREHSKP